VIGLGVILAWLVITHVADPTGAGEMVADYGFFLSSAAFGAAIRFQATVRVRDVEQARLRQRNELARELHDSVGHHVSAIAVQAQAGRALAASDPARALAVLATIEEAASRTLEEMRAMVGGLRDGAEPDFAPQPGVGDIERLARQVDGWPRVDVQLSGDFADLPRSVGRALYRLAQESVTNAIRHAPHATRITVHVTDEGEQVRLTVSDDGDGRTPAPMSSAYGLVGMTERATLLGGSLRAGPNPHRGWTVDALLPKGGAR
jgi:signal transduction histidine kinase